MFTKMMIPINQPTFQTPLNCQSTHKSIILTYLMIKAEDAIFFFQVYFLLPLPIYIHIQDEIENFRLGDKFLPTETQY